MVEGHRGTDMPWSLNAPGSGAKTGAATHSFKQSEEPRPGLGLRRSARPQPARYDRTSRYVMAFALLQVPDSGIRTNHDSMRPVHPRRRCPKGSPREPKNG